MRVLRQILFTAAMVIGVALTASAQSSEQPKRPPPKDPPPKVVVPQDKKPPPPRDDKKGDGKKPGLAWIEPKKVTDYLV
jgi:hypothetical protein